MKVYLGIDPGASGAAAFLRPDEGCAIVADTPTLPYTKSSGRIGHLLDEDAMTDLIRGMMPGNTIFAAIEWAQAMPKQGVTGVFNYGVGFGLWLGVLAGLGVPRVKVRPQRWMKEMFAGYGQHDKALSVKVAKELFPAVDLRLKKHHGRAEALLIAEWARRTHA